jgi:hypothetical protein
VDIDEEWRPFPGVSVAPRSSVRVTRRTTYIYDFDSDEVVEEEIILPATDITFPAPAVPSYLPAPEVVDLAESDSETELVSDEGVEESKGDN